MNDILALIGFKHVGKSTLGEALAQQLHRPFYDVDHYVEQVYESRFVSRLNCRQIMAKHDEPYFRRLETEVLYHMPVDLPAVIALGGGAPLFADNQGWLQQVRVIHVTAPVDVVWARIEASGLPGFFDKHVSAKQAFQQLWQERDATYRRLAHVTIHNDQDLATVTHRLWSQLTALSTT
jgi:shikimate kinase